MLAFVFIRVETDMSSRIITQLTKIEGVKEIHELTGDIDIIAKVEADNIDDLSKLIFKIREIEGVQGTDTRIVLASFSLKR